MYSVVLATMLVAGSSTPAWHCHSCYSGYSGYSGYSCCYSGYSGYSCYSCHGCHSCYSYPGYRIFPIFHHHHSCYSCCSCYTPVYYGCSCSCSCYSSCSSCYTCCSSTVIVSPGPRVIPVQPGGVSEVDALRLENERLRKELNKDKLPAPKKSDGEVSAPAQVSRVTVTLPASARLWIENVECPLTSSVRTFDTPPLRSNQQYLYNVKMEVMQNGQLVSQTQRAIITPGQPVQVDFNAGAVTTAAR